MPLYISNVPVVGPRMNLLSFSPFTRVSDKITFIFGWPMSLLLFLSLHILKRKFYQIIQTGSIIWIRIWEAYEIQFHPQTKCKALISRRAFILAITMMWLKNILRFLNEAWFTPLVFALMNIALPSSLYQTWLAKSPLVQSVSVTKSQLTPVW